ncbi:MAG: RpiB/LacA/LacB family sugar-phosphate isomerase [Deltaproteobacteria bacterium]
MKKVVISCDHGAVDLKNEIIRFFQKKNYEVTVLGAQNADAVDYPDVALAACNEFKKGGYEFGVLLCGTGIGVTMAANKVRGIRCALIFDLFTAEMARAHNNANFIAFGGRIKYSVPVTEMIEKFMTTAFAGDRHERRINKIMAIEDKC